MLLSEQTMSTNDSMHAVAGASRVDELHVWCVLYYVCRQGVTGVWVIVLVEGCCVIVPCKLRYTKIR